MQNPKLFRFQLIGLLALLQVCSIGLIVIFTDLYQELGYLLIVFTILLSSLILSGLLVKRAGQRVSTWRELAINDQLTGAYNRHFLFSKGRGLYESAKKQNDNLSLAVIDIDDFKYVNDTFGHNVGDEVLKSLAGRISHQLKEKDIFARMGGEEFVILFPSTLAEHAEDVISRIQRNLRKEPICTSKGAIYLTLSIGLGSTVGDDNASFEGFIDSVDQALYRAKDSGKNQILMAA